MVSLHLVVHGRKLSMPYYLSALFPVINRGSKSIRRDSHSRIIFYAAMTPEKSSFSIFIISFFDKKSQTFVNVSTALTGRFDHRRNHRSCAFKRNSNAFCGTRGFTHCDGEFFCVRGSCL